MFPKVFKTYEKCYSDFFAQKLFSKYFFNFKICSNLPNTKLSHTATQFLLNKEKNENLEMARGGKEAYPFPFIPFHPFFPSSISLILLIFFATFLFFLLTRFLIQHSIRHDTTLKYEKLFANLA